MMRGHDESCLSCGIVTVLLVTVIMAVARVVVWPLVFLLATWLLIEAARSDDELIEPTPEEYADIQTWIPIDCCWSNNCCRKVKPSALIPLSRDQYRVELTKQVITRRGWSRDGNTWRCTCDLIDGQWVVHPKAKTRCVFPAPQGY